VPLPLLIAVWVLLALVAVAVLVTVTVGWGHDAWKGTEAEGNIKTIQAIVLGLGFLGVVAGAVVTYRRQQTMQDQLDHDRERLDHERNNDQDRLDEDRRKYQLELDKYAQEQAKYAQQQVRETQRRQQERYAQGAQMLADQSPAVRIAGLNVIAALGREVVAEEELRQTCVNLICAYLRASAPQTQRPAQQEGQEGLPVSGFTEAYRVVSSEACRLLPSLLEMVPSGDPAEGPPHPLDLDLRQVNLSDLDLRARCLGTVRFAGATFSGAAEFAGATFSGDAGFAGAIFDELADFEGAKFSGAVVFNKAKFSWETNFQGTKFSKKPLSRGARFVEYASEDELPGFRVGPARRVAGSSKFFEGAVFGPEQQDDDGEEAVPPS